MIIKMEMFLCKHILLLLYDIMYISTSMYIGRFRYNAEKEEMIEGRRSFGMF